MRVAIVTIGDEILIGQINDTNSVWMSRELTALGVHIYEMTTISDTQEHIVKTLDRLIGKVDMVLMTGGLGPTKDDLTKEVLNTYFGGKLVMNQEVLATIESFFSKRGRTMIESNRRQALVPDTCTPLTNNHGTAPGMWFTREGTHVVSMPGVPYEMKPMLLEQVIPSMAEHMGLPDLVHRTVMTQGVPESYLAEMISEWERGLPECMKLAYLPRPGIVRLRLTVMGKSTEEAGLLLDEKIGALHQVIPEHIFGYDDMPLEQAIGVLMKEKGLKLSTAESCTGGNIARLITAIPGSSDYFRGSVIAYSNDMKVRTLGVDPVLIEDHGAVSREVVEAMALGGLGMTGTDVSMATSGIAGPGGGTDDKPVGLVWIAVACGNKLISREFRFGGHRALVIEQASIMAMGMLRKLLAGIDGGGLK
ncbi:MAG: competence/damage-inducible protein A [Bacteroidales bacterium]|nr:competence/damage-inducible protein A [Bacteroidales bacterium]